MAIIMTQHIPGMPAAAYDEILAHTADSLRAGDGFISHAAVIDADGLTVTEFWDSREQWQHWYDEHIKPNLPADAPAVEITELHNVLAR